MKKTVVLNVVGLTRGLIGEHTPFIKSFLERGASATITPQLPAVTCAVQATYLTGKTPSDHGIVGNGWYFKEEHEVKFWRQSNSLIQSEKIWDKLKMLDSNFSCANMFWWYNMYSNADYSVTPRPNYLADGRKIPDVYSYPSELRDHLQNELGTFPLFHFWGPKTSIKSSQWIADASLKTDVLYDPTLTLVYLPHLDYNMQRHGTDVTKISKDLREIDEVVKKLVEFYETKSAHIIILSEYGITNVNNPIHLNRKLRQEGYLGVRVERGLELLDAGASRAFAVADHQLAHVYVKDKKDLDKVKAILKGLKGVERVLSGSEIKELHLDHERCGDLVVIADKDSWFTYYFWLDDTKAPDYARMVDIHKKPGYDPVEMLTDPKDKFLMPKVIWKLLKKKLGFRTVMDIIPLDATLVKGSHGRMPEDSNDHPILITNKKGETLKDRLLATEVYGIIEKHLINS
ncbi:alkaline phosphatase family protein [Arenibacter troitsensis]|uniref:Predicted pyrophosphatase or phosphodiesterase, AlkP superfamily n=1 Tax=Arenibacter troitsensis TaxID=188872 RepID=A0A1X7IBY3_9FLAO|nr:nucleotide pyrophosphatase/phosphodiesterase family protein [Arenibacter troitsensis]SMG11657.1 Predicted pyrophosphatase or phosphodiesterase, AlkP superfamily [Arenibacter troitsensis]